jgi:nucleotide-binding universal stress UspA family protein
MRKIIVPVDFSNSSVKALENAVSIAKRVDGEIGIIHVNKLKTFGSVFGGHTTSESVGMIEKNMESLLKSIDFKNVPVTHTLRTGNVAKEVLQYAEESNAYLIIIGTHGESGHIESWMGGNAYKIINSAPCPVLNMPETDKPFDLKKIVAPIDTTITTRHKIPFTAELANFYRAEIFVLGVCVDESTEFVNRLDSYCYQVRKFLNQANVPNEYEFVTGSNITTMTIDYAKKINADLIVTMTDHDSGNIFMSSHAQQMVTKSPLPVLTINPTIDVENFQY